MSQGRANIRRILMTADAVGGVWTYALELCRGLEQHGIEVVLATMGPRPRAEQRRDVQKLSNVFLEESSFALEWSDQPWEEVDRAGDWLLDLEVRYEPDVVHLNGYAHGALPWNVPVLVVGHSCVLSWWRAVKGESAPATWQTYRQRVAAGIRAAELVVAPSAAMLRELQRDYGPIPHWKVLPNGRSMPASAGSRTKEPFVLSVGRLWDEAKNVRLLAEAARGLSWPVLVAGDTRSPQGTTAEFADLQALGARSPQEVWQLMSRASIYALPARYEPFGLSALEAAQSGCALVLGDIPTLREIWGDAAEYVAVNNSEQLQRTLNTLIQNPSELSCRSQAARLRAARYSSDAMTAAYLDTYRSLATPRATVTTALATLS
jgi:glycogen synthase